MNDKLNGAVPLTEDDLENVVGGLRQSPRVRVTSSQTISSAEDPLKGGRLICPNCGNVMSKAAGCTNPICVNSTNIARA